MKKVYVYVALLLIWFSVFVIPTAKAEATIPLVLPVPDTTEWAVYAGYNSQYAVFTTADGKVHICMLFPAYTACGDYTFSSATDTLDGRLRYVVPADLSAYSGIYVYPYPIAENHTAWDIGNNAKTAVVVVAGVAFAIVLIRWVLVFAERLGRWV